MSASLDIIICTYNREELLRNCVQSLVKQDTTEFTIYIVNNYLTPLSRETQDFINTLSQIFMIHHPVAGLSEARNAGIAASKAVWIAFLDDDAKAGIDYVSRILAITQQENWSCFGGGINSWWKYGRPRWLKETFGAKPKLSDEKQEITNDYNWGSNIIIKRDALNEIGGFPTAIGMKGTHLGYAAENIVQINLRERGHVIGYDPDLVIDHVVAPQKLKLWWHVRASYATGRDGISVFPDQYKFRGMIDSFKKSLSTPIKGIYKLISEREYFPENLLLDLIQPVALLLGKIRAVLRS